MFGRRITLFRLFGFAVRADASWLIVVALVTWSLATGVFPRLHPGLTPRTYWLMGGIGALIFFLSIVLHEMSHALVARRFGIPMRGITLFVFGGVAEMDDEPPSPKAELLMALAGPAMSVVIGVVCLGGAALGAMQNLRGEAVAILQYLGFTNLILAVFNMLPAFPLDGGRVLRALIWWRTQNIRKATRVSSQVGSGFGILLILLGLFSLFTGSLVQGLWWFLIGMFVRGAAANSYQQIVVRETLAGMPVSRFMTATPVTVSRSLSVRELIEDYIYRYHFRMYPVVDDGRLVGCVSTREVHALPREEWDRQTVGAIAQQCQTDNSIAPHADALQALTRMSRSKVSRLMVVEGDRLLGIITIKDLVRFLSLKMELEEG
ncbi:MAG TPA: site-2 protease family protein [Thermoanaerobaculia bacterium]